MVDINRACITLTVLFAPALPRSVTPLRRRKANEMPTNELLEMIAMWRDRAEKAEAELDALKCCGNCRHWTRPSIFEATVCALVTDDGDDRVPGDHVCEQWSHSILEATKGAP
jgi:hypothetical protein